MRWCVDWWCVCVVGGMDEGLMAIFLVSHRLAACRCLAVACELLKSLKLRKLDNPILLMLTDSLVKE